MEKLHKSIRDYKILLGNIEIAVYYFTLLNRENKLVREITLTESCGESVIEFDDYFKKKVKDEVSRDSFAKGRLANFDVTQDGRKYFNFLLNEHGVEYDFETSTLRELESICADKAN